MNKHSDIPMEVKMIIPFAVWLEHHPIISNILLVLMSIALTLAVFMYDFTIPAYK